MQTAVQKLDLRECTSQNHTLVNEKYGIITQRNSLCQITAKNVNSKVQLLTAGGNLKKVKKLKEAQRKG